ncbi:MAG: metal-dependent hydrolase [Planctomycetes bacterium]|nr:metal-dependent hydrolase [Planctomycetota bacterium]
MPTVMTHAAVAWGLARAARPRSPAPALAAARERACVVVAMLPDLDVLAFTLGIPYAHPLGHRGASHSLLGAVVLGLGAWLLLRRLLRGVEGARPGGLDLALLVVAAASHGLLDMLTDGGEGVGLLVPFSDTRHFWPRQPIPVSPIGLVGFLAHGLPVLAWEVLLLWPAAAVGALLGGAGPWRTRAWGAAALALAAAGAWAWRLHLIAWDHGR